MFILPGKWSDVFFFFWYYLHPPHSLSLTLTLAHCTTMVRRLNSIRKGGRKNRTRRVSCGRATVSKRCALPRRTACRLIKRRGGTKDVYKLSQSNTVHVFDLDDNLFHSRAFNTCRINGVEYRLTGLDYNLFSDLVNQTRNCGAVWDFANFGDNEAESEKYFKEGDEHDAETFCIPIARTVQKLTDAVKGGCDLGVITTRGHLRHHLAAILNQKFGLLDVPNRFYGPNVFCLTDFHDAAHGGCPFIEEQRPIILSEDHQTPPAGIQYVPSIDLTMFFNKTEDQEKILNPDLTDRTLAAGNQAMITEIQEEVANGNFKRAHKLSELENSMPLVRLTTGEKKLTALLHFIRQGYKVIHFYDDLPSVTRKINEALERNDFQKKIENDNQDLKICWTKYKKRDTEIHIYNTSKWSDLSQNQVTLDAWARKDDTIRNTGKFDKWYKALQDLKTTISDSEGQEAADDWIIQLEKYRTKVVGSDIGSKVQEILR